MIYFSLQQQCSSHASCSFLQLAVLHWFLCPFVIWISAFDRNVSQAQLCPWQRCRQVLHSCPSTKRSQAGREGRISPCGADGLQWLGKLEQCNQHCVHSPGRGNSFWGTGRCEPGLAPLGRSSAPSALEPLWAAVHSSCAIRIPFLSRMIFIPLPSLYCSSETTSDLGVSGCYFHAKRSDRENARLQYVELQIWLWKSVLKAVGKNNSSMTQLWPFIS